MKSKFISTGATAPVPLKDALAKHDSLAAALDKVRSGELSATAPCDAVHNSWPAAEREKLAAVMNTQYPYSPKP